MLPLKIPDKLTHAQRQLLDAKGLKERDYVRDERGRFAETEGGDGGTPTPAPAYAREAELRRDEGVRYLAGLLGVNPYDLKTETDAHVRDIVNGTESVIRVDSSVLGQILDDGELHNRFAGADDSMTRPDAGVWREQWEEQAFGLAPNAPPEDRPIYGFLADTPSQELLKMGTPQGVGRYGDVAIVLNDDVRERTTFTLGDSGALNATSYEPGITDPEMMANTTPQPLTTPSSDAWDWAGEHSFGSSFDNTVFTEDPRELPTADEKLQGGGYYETQIHGGVTTSDIAKVVFTVDVTEMPWQESTIAPLQARLTEMGIPWETDYRARMEPYTPQPWEDPATAPLGTYDPDYERRVAALWQMLRKEREYVRDEQGRFAETGGTSSPLAPATGSGRPDEALANLIEKMDKDITSRADARRYRDFAGSWTDVAAIFAKNDNVREIGAAITEQAKTDPELQAWLANPENQPYQSSVWGLALEVEDPNERSIERMWAMTVNGDLWGQDPSAEEFGIKMPSDPAEANALYWAATLQDTWAKSASDTEQFSLALQDRANEIFGLGIDVHGLAGGAGGQFDDLKEFSAGYAPVLDAYLRTEYDRTQEMFKEAGITEVTLWRGVHFAGDEGYGVTNWNPQEGEGAEVQTNPLSSWSSSYSTAHTFAGDGVTFNAQVPVERIISCPYTGQGCLTETEFVVLGGTDRVTVESAVIG